MHWMVIFVKMDLRIILEIGLHFAQSHLKFHSTPFKRWKLDWLLKF